MKQVRDHYNKKAKKENFAARSIYKLEEIDTSQKLFKQGHAVLDLGCSPGSWMQYVSTKIGEKGRVVGIDLKNIGIGLKPNMSFYRISIEELLKQPDHPVNELRYNNIVSDMAPNTTGIPERDALVSSEICELALDFGRSRLFRGGNMVVKIFQGNRMNEIVDLFKEDFGVVRIIKPKSSRPESREIFILGKGKS